MAGSTAQTALASLLMLRSLTRFIASRLYTALQRPDPAYLYRRGGLGEVIRHLKTCASARRTRAILAQFGARIDPATLEIAPCVTIHPPRPERSSTGFANLEVGAHVHIGWDVFLDLSDRLLIEDNVHIGMRAILLTHFGIGAASSGKPLAGLFPPREAPTILRRGCSVGAGAIVLPGVTVGEDAIVGAGVVVSSDVAPRTVIAESGRTAFVLPEHAVDALRNGGAEQGTL